MLIKRFYEVDPLSCPACGSQMEVVALIEPPQEDVIERILRGRHSLPRIEFNLVAFAFLKHLAILFG